MKHLNSTTPPRPAPQITYTDEDEKGQASPVKSKEELTEANGDIPSESLPMLPNDDTFPLGKRQFV